MIITPSFRPLAGAALMVFTLQAGAQEFPTRPIRIISPFEAGTTTDVLARLAGQVLTDAFGRQVVIENRPGAGGRVGTELAAKATPDGYTLAMAPSGAIGISPVLYARVPYDVKRDFAYITNIATQAQVLVSSPASPLRSVEDLVNAARAKPGTLNYASVGPGTATHLSMEMLKGYAKLDMTHVAFKGSTPAHVELLGGRVQIMFDGLPSAMPHIRAGRLRGIAVSTRERQSFLPELPSVAESGYPEYDAFGWGGLMAPARVPAAVLDRINAELVRGMRTSQFRERLAALGANVAAGTRAEFTAFVAAENEKWGRIVKQAGVKVEE